MNANPPSTVDEYLAGLSEEARAALERLRAAIKEVVPEATESISYRIPTFSYNGPLVAMSAHKNHYSLHVMSPDLFASLEDEFRDYETTKASVHFGYGDPLPVQLVERVVRARVEENAARPERYGRRP